MGSGARLRGTSRYRRWTGMVTGGSQVRTSWLSGETCTLGRKVLVMSPQALQGRVDSIGKVGWKIESRKSRAL